MLNTILFDMGGTIEDIWYNAETSQTATAKIMNLLLENDMDSGCNPTTFWNRLNEGVQSYKRWSQSRMLEKKPEEIWPEFYLKSFHFPTEKLAALAEDLGQIWESTYYHREMRSDVLETLEALRARGYKLGIISNTASLYSVFLVLQQYGIRDFFQDVTLSSVTGYRKPHPSIFEISLYQMQASPENCMYVGDTMSRDIIGSKKAGFAKSVQIQSFMTAHSDTNVTNTSYAPDHVIYNMIELVGYLDQLNPDRIP